MNNIRNNDVKYEETWTSSQQTRVGYNNENR